MTQPVYIIDAFAEKSMQGNPAGVCPLESWLPDDVMQAIAGELSLSETVFFAPSSSADDAAVARYDIRWFTPTREVDMIGHATLAAGYLALERLKPHAGEAVFVSPTGTMSVRRGPSGLEMEMPALPPRPIVAPTDLAAALGATPVEFHAAKHYLAVFETAEEIADLSPDFGLLARLPLPAVIVTAKAEGEFDFVSRFFAPANGVPEDPVSGVAHCCLVPYWSERLGKKNLVGRQLSKRGGTLVCQEKGDRVILAGSAAIFLEGQIAL